ncbi:unnamed protein product, partial [Rotaria socialis]
MFSNFLLTNIDDKDSAKELQRNQQTIVDELRKQCKSFNKERIISQLNNGYQIDRAFHLHVPNEIKHIARKHGLPEVKWDQIYQNLVAENIDDHTKILLAQTIKYSIKNNTASVKPKELLEVLRKNNDALVKSEFVWALSYQLSNSFAKDSKEIINENFIDEINSIIEGSENKLNRNSVIFLNDQLQRYFYGNHLDYRESSHVRIKTSVNYSKKMPQKFVTKNQQTTKIKYKSTQSEESADKLNSVNVFKNLNKKIKMNSNTESLPTIPDKDGSDTSIFRDTYDEVVHLYNRIKSGKTLKRKDKDEYLPSKFIGPGKKWCSEKIADTGIMVANPVVTGIWLGIMSIKKSVESPTVSTLRSYGKCINRIMEPLFVDKMIAAIFLEISKKKILHENAIKLLMDCIDTLDQVEEKVLGGATKKTEAAKTIALYNQSRNDTKIIDFLRRPLKMYVNDPDIAANVARKIDVERIKDSKELENILSYEVNQIRLAAISTIYNCAIRNSAILNEERLKKIETCLTDNDIEFNQFVIRILGTLGDSNIINYKSLFENCLANLERHVNIDDSINYIHQQSKDVNRCNELFNEDVILTISDLVRKTTLNEETKIICCAIINNYLEYSYSKGLNEAQLENYVDLINDPHYSSDLKLEALRSIVLTVEKKQKLSDFLIEALINNINQIDDKFDNFIIVTLGIVSEKQIITKIDKLSIKLLDDWVIVGEGTDITFEKSSKDTSDCQSISSIVAQIFVKSLQNNVKIAEESLEYLAKALNSNDKQTRILSAKSLYLTLKTHRIKNNVLLELREHVEDRIPDVSVYSIVVYANSLAKLSKLQQPIIRSLIEFLPTIYVFEDLQLGEESFADEVNQNILYVLLNDDKIEKFKDNVFQIFDHILLFENHQQADVIDILRRYSAARHPIPESTIFALENVVDIPEFSNKVLEVFENMIKNKQIVSDKILHIFVDTLYLTDNEQLREKSFQLLDTANDNQDISDEIFDILELERAALNINSRYWDSYYAIAYLLTKTKEGKKLTINGFIEINKQIDGLFLPVEKILKVLHNVSINGQIIPNELVDKLVKKFDPAQKQYYLLQIFESLVKNNQNIPSELSLKLEKALEYKHMYDQVLFIFVLQGQKGENLSSNIISKILDKFSGLDNSLIMQQYLSVICSVIKKVDCFEYDSKNSSSSKTHSQVFDISFIDRVQSALIHALETGNQDVICKSISGFIELASLGTVKLQVKSIEVLLSLVAKTICDKSMKEEINKILDSSKLEQNQKCTLELCNLKYDSNDQFLDILATFDKPKLLEQNFDQINSIIENCPKLNSKALNILMECSNKKDIPDKLLNSIGVLLASTNSKTINSLCCRLIHEMTEAGRKLTDDIISLIFVQDKNERPLEILKRISKNQTISQELKDKIALFSKIDPTMSIDITILDEFLNSIRQELQRNHTLSHLSIEKLLLIPIPTNHIEENSFNIDVEQKLLDIFAEILIENPDYSLNQSIVDRLEMALLSKKIDKNILDAYKEVIKRTQCQTNNFSRVFDVFIDILDENGSYFKYHFDILVCLALASEARTISTLEPFEINLFSDEDIIRSWSFRGLRAAYEREYQSLDFQEWCDNIIDKLEEKTKSEVHFDLDLFETITSVKYIDFEKIRDKPQEQWNRELLIFDLIERLEISEAERFLFYKTWLEIEELEKFQNGKSNILLKLLHRILLNNTMSFHKFYGVTKILNRIDFASAHKILSYSKNPCFDLQKRYLAKLLDQLLSEKENINSKYIDDLAVNMMSKFDLNISHQLLNALENIDSLREFENVLNFAQENNIEISDIYVKETTISVLKRSLEIKFLGKKIVKTDRLKLALNIDNLLDKNWTFEQLNKIFSKLKTSDNVEKRVKEEKFLHVLEILSQYKISPTPENQEKILLALDKPPEKWLQQVNRLAIESNFSEIGEIRSAVGLIEELGNINSNNEDLKNFMGINLLEVVERIKRSDLISQVLDNTIRDQSIYITQWTEKQIRRWADIVKENVDCWTKINDFTIEALAVIKQANLLHTEFNLTDAQILSCLIALNANVDKGRLLQIGTGEGKSTIVSVLAVIHALKGKKVDIITSSPVLAERDAKEKAKFYNMFDLQCSDNNDKSIYLAGPKKCYWKDIVYGEATQFQFDILRTEYAQLNTLDDRKCEVAIVDEVDSMLIDDSSKIARLATSMAGMDQLHIIYHVLWNRIVYLQDKIIEINDKMYLLYGKVGFEEGKMILEYADEKGNIIKISDLRTYLASTSDISHMGQSIPENEELDVFIKKILDIYVRELIKTSIKIPKNFVDFVDTQIPKWIDNAIVALNYQEKVHYVVQEDLIKPVDYYSTGIVQSSTNWSDGLHQFLQIKHNLKMTSETFTTNFLSNRGYFTRYGSNLFGLTGTLGSEKTKQVLVDAYKVDLVIIPNLRRKQYISLPDMVAMNETEWLEEVCCSAMNESSKERGILIICETIERSILIAEKLKGEYRSSGIKLYTMNNMNQEKNVEAVYPGEIIIATNLAGRGIDIKTDQIEKNGGLHVIVTFMPSNKRVEEQAFGRTARQGKRGTGQRILNAASLTHNKDFDTQKITQLRDRIEAEMLSNFEDYEFKVITLKDELFAKFCSLLNKIRQDIRKKMRLFSTIKNEVKSVFTNVAPSVYESNVLLSIEEQWAMFLRKIDDQKSSIDIEKVHKEYAEFRERIIKDYSDNCVIKNPYYHIVIGNDLVINDSSLISKYKEAMKHFNRAIELDPDHSAAAFAGTGWLLLKGKKRLIFSDQLDLDYKESAVRAFNRALEILSEEMAVLTSIQTLLQHRCPNMNTALSKQLIQKINILGTYCNSLENVVAVVRKSQRLIQIKEIIDYPRRSVYTNETEVARRIISYDRIEKERGELCGIRLISHDHVDNDIMDAIQNRKEIALIKDDENQFTVLYKKKKEKSSLGSWKIENYELRYYLLSLNYNRTILDRKECSKIYVIIYENVTINNGYIRSDFSVFLKDLTNDSKYEITFNDLTVRQDSGTVDQAENIIYQAVSKHVLYGAPILNNSGRYISVSITQINAERLKAFLNPNIEIKEATRDVALLQLKEKISFFHRHLLPENWSLDLCPVNLEIFLDNNKIEMKSNLQARDAIEILKKRQPDENIQCNLSFISANEISKVLQEKVLSHSIQTIEFIGLDGYNVKEKLRNIQSNSITLEISDSKDKLLEVLTCLDLQYVELYSYDKEKSNHRNIREVVDKITAERIIKEYEKDNTTIRLIDIPIHEIEEIIDKCPNATYNISFIRIRNFDRLLKGLNNELVNIHFDELELEPAIKLIRQIRKENLDFSLVLKKLTKGQAERLMKEAPVEQENIEINKVKSLNELFMNESRP